MKLPTRATTKKARTARNNERESVNHPEHYGGDTVYEAIKVIEAWDLGFHLGNTVKYIARAGKKEPARTLEDLKKAAWYLQRKIESLTPKH
jgi:hypothetical protein